MPPPDKIIDSNPQTSVEQSPDAEIIKLVEQHPETFCSTSIEDIKVASADNVNDSYKIRFNLHPRTYVTHQGMTIFMLGKPNGMGQETFITRNPLIVDKLKNAGYSTMKVDDQGNGKMTEAGTPFANPGNVNMPYIKNFLQSQEAGSTNSRLERNRKIEVVDKDAEYMNGEDFEKRYGFTKVDYVENKYEPEFLNRTTV